MDKLSREQIKKLHNGQKREKDCLEIRIINTALTLYDENEKIKAGIEGMKQRLQEEIYFLESSNVQYDQAKITGYTPQIDHGKMRFKAKILEEILNDISALCGKEEK